MVIQAAAAELLLPSDHDRARAATVVVRSVADQPFCSIAWPPCDPRPDSAELDGVARLWFIGRRVL
jgi:hypothetical protein